MEQERLVTGLLPWHQEQYSRLVGLQAEQRLGHAWLLAGHQGTGKLALALHFTRYLFCTAPVGTSPCGHCQDCHLFEVGSHPDLWLIQPEKKLITIDQIRDSIDFARNTSQRGMKVLILAPAEAMNPNAANALLKLLEEPPPRTLLLLISHQPGLLLATIRSRCQVLRCPLPAPEVASRWLENQGFAGNIATALQKAGGAPFRALLQAGDETERLGLLTCLEGLAGGTLYPVEAAKKCDKYDILTSIDLLLLCAADLAASLQSGCPLRDADLQGLAGKLKLGQKSADFSRQRQLHVLYQELQQARKVALASNNANPQLLLESLFGRWRQLGQSSRLQGSM
jgi:DNA polymerase-3 subunit delta'